VGEWVGERGLQRCIDRYHPLATPQLRRRARLTAGATPQRERLPLARKELHAPGMLSQGRPPSPLGLAIA
jgi:hypothetical protein